ERGVPTEAVQQVTVDRGEITFYVRREHLVDVCRTLRDDPALRFELCGSVSGVDYGPEVPQRLHSVYHLTSMTYRRRIRLEVCVDVDDELYAITSTGGVIRTSAKEVRKAGRQTKGVRLMNLGDGATLLAVARNADEASDPDTEGNK
ncbi:NADH-quinone oxidoreductase subunit C, partial [Streptomyces griseoaurantiacus]|uniref:NADH-quinone oxidoreductase subunit C n=1 Tax=Streptomyces griseoaurantiacus TaxID=68213 RepID=UPI001782485A